MKQIAFLLFVGVSMAACNRAVDDPNRLEPVTRMDSISYIIGYDYGTGIRSQEIKANPQMIYKGVYDALINEKAILDDAVQSRLIDEFNLEMEEIENRKFQEMIAANKREGQKFLEENKKREGVTALPGGLQYKVLKIGSGDFPSPSDSVTIHYRAMYIDRTTFDMSYDEGPVDIRINNLVKGLAEGIQLMRPGAIYEFFIPPHIGYGDRNYLDLIPAGSTVIYSVELIKIHD